jgi:hypothetical protein
VIPPTDITREALSIFTDALATASAALAQAVDRIEALSERDPLAYVDYLPIAEPTPEAADARAVIEAALDARDPAQVRMDERVEAGAK